MAEVGSVSVLFGNNALSRSNMLPYWEDFQKYFITLYIIFVVLFGITSTAELPNCLPATSELASNMTDAESQFFASYCRSQSSGWIDPVQIRLVIVLIVFFGAIVSNSCLEEKGISTSVQIYSKAEEDILDLNISLEKLKLKVVTPILVERHSNTPEMKIREVVMSLLSFNGKDPTHALFNRCVSSLALLVIAFAYGLFLFSPAAVANFSPYTFNCVTHDDLNWDREYTWLTCCSSWSSLDWSIVALYQLVVTLHVISCTWSLWKIRRIRKCVTEFGGPGNVDFLKSRRCMLILAELSQCVKEKESIFYDFIKFVFDEDTLRIIERSIPSALGLQGCEIDGGFVAVFERMVTRVHLRVFTSLHDRLIENLIKRKKLKNIVLLLNKFAGFDDLKTKADLMNMLDDEGNNILYYALNREPGFAEFKTTAAAVLISATKIEGRCVVYGNKRIKGDDFIQSQYNEDPTYPVKTKLMLQKLINTPRM